MSNVTHPSHYNSGKIEVIEAIEDWKLNYHCGNVVKYVARAGKKDPAKHIEDLEKAKWYLEREIENLRAGKEGRESTKPNHMNLKQSKQIVEACDAYIFIAEETLPIGAWCVLDLKTSRARLKTL